MFSAQSKFVAVPRPWTVPETLLILLQLDADPVARGFIPGIIMPGGGSSFTGMVSKVVLRFF